MTIKRNGDWHFVSTNKSAEGETIKHKGSYIWATGEATNHHHAIKVKDPKNMVLTKMPNGSYLVELKEPATVSHPEHSLKGDLIVQPGHYELIQRREKDWFSGAVRRVID